MNTSLQMATSMGVMSSAEAVTKPKNEDIIP
jgi:hypothetical protein